MRGIRISRWARCAAHRAAGLVRASAERVAALVVPADDHLHGRQGQAGVKDLCQEHGQVLAVPPAVTKGLLGGTGHVAAASIGQIGEVLHGHPDGLSDCAGEATVTFEIIALNIPLPHRPVISGQTMSVATASRVE